MNASFLHRSVASRDTAAPVVSALSSGRPLESALRARLESRFGHDLGSVRIHRERQDEPIPSNDVDIQRDRRLTPLSCPQLEPIKRAFDERTAIDLNTAPPQVHAVLRSPGHQPDHAVRSRFERLFAQDFSELRLHSDESAATAAAAVRAKAFTIGQHIVFGMGQYAPQTPRGENLIAHELAHVVQQRAKGTQARTVLQCDPEDTAKAAETLKRESEVALAEPLTTEEMWNALLTRRAQPLSIPATVVNEADTRIATLDQQIADADRRLEGLRGQEAAEVQVERKRLLAEKTRLTRGKRLGTPGLGARAGTGQITYAAIQVIDANGRRIALEFAETSSTEHAEERIIGRLRATVKPEQLQGARIIVVGDQTVCGERCRPALIAFARDHGIAAVEASVFVRPRIGGGGEATPRSTMRGATKPSSEGVPLTENTDVIYRRPTTTAKPGQPPPTAPAPKVTTARGGSSKAGGGSTAPGGASQTSQSPGTPAGAPPTAATVPKTPQASGQPQPAKESPAVKTSTAQKKPAPTQPTPAKVQKTAQKSGEPQPAKESPAAKTGTAQKKPAPTQTPPGTSGQGSKITGTAVSAAGRGMDILLGETQAKITQLAQGHPEEKALVEAINATNVFKDLKSFIHDPKKFTAQQASTAMIEAVFEHFSDSLEKTENTFFTNYPSAATLHTNPINTGVSLEDYEQRYKAALARLRLPDARKTLLYALVALGINENTPADVIKARLREVDIYLANAPGIANDVRAYYAAKDAYAYALAVMQGTVQNLSDKLAALPSDFADDIRRRGDALGKAGSIMQDFANRLIQTGLAAFAPGEYAWSQFTSLAKGFSGLSKKLDEFAYVAGQRKDHYRLELERLEKQASTLDQTLLHAMK